MNRTTTSAYFEGLSKGIIDDIKRLSDDEILNTDIDELYNYFLQKYVIQEIVLYLEHKDIDFKEVNIKKKGYNPFSNQDTIEVDGYKIIYEIPFEGDKGLFLLIPSSFTSAGIPKFKVIDGKENDYSKIVYTIEFEKSELPENFTYEIKEKKFNNDFKNHITTVNNLNKDIRQFNKQLENIIKNALDTRKQKAKDFIEIAKKLEIPLRKNPNAPNVKPILLKKSIKKLPEKPNTKEQKEYYAITDDDYNNIKNIISLVGCSFERAARSFVNFDEVTLCDIIISIFNTYYLQTATRETFSRNGKTDIRIFFENQAAYIAECKIWHGEIEFEKAIKQLISYTTWRDEKTSLIIFNKDNKDFNKILNKIQFFLEISDF